MVHPWNGHGGELPEGVRGRVKELRGELCGGVVEGDGVRLATGNEDCAIREDHAVPESAGESHVADRLYRWCSIRVSNRDHVRIARRVNVLVAWAAAHSQDLPVDSIKHRSIATHAVSVASASTRPCLRASAGGAVPIHCFARARLENGGALPAKEPAVVIGTVNTCDDG